VSGSSRSQARILLELDALIAEFGQVGDDRLLLMSALLIADEMLDARARVDALEAALVAVQAGKASRSREPA